MLPVFKQVHKKKNLVYLRSVQKYFGGGVGWLNFLASIFLSRFPPLESFKTF